MGSAITCAVDAIDGYAMHPGNKHTVPLPSFHTDLQLCTAAMTWPNCMLNPHSRFAVRDVCNLVCHEVSRPLLALIGGRIDDSTDLFLSLDLGTAAEWRGQCQLQNEPSYSAAVSLAGQAMAVGGADNWKPNNQVQLWSPRSNVWQDGPDLRRRRHHHTATVLADDAVVACGGTSARGSVEVLRAGAMQWTEDETMPFHVYDHAATCPRTDPTKVVVMGGHQRELPSAATHCYDATSDRWDSSLPAMSVARAALCAVALGDGCSYAVGGCDCQWASLSLVERLDLRTPEWRVVSHMPEGRSYCAAVVLDEWSFVVLGGVGNDGASASAFVYDSRADRWSDRPEWALPSPVYGHAVVNVHV